MKITDRNQYKLGLMGLAFLRNWLTGDESKNELILQDLKSILGTLDKPEGKSQSLKGYDIGEGYEKWADNYDQMPNLLIDAEEPEVRKILQGLPIGRAVDVACGTGRYTAILHKLGHKVTGIDQSKSMLRIAKGKNPNIDFVVADISKKLPLPDESYDLALSSLALTHFKNLDAPIKQISSLVKKDGIVLLSDIHPMIVALGGHADFFDKAGEHGFITNYVHWHSEYLNEFKKNNLEVVSCYEPELESVHTHILEMAFSLKKETVETALNGLPVALIWVLRRK
jgi:ubiquinone/menaquinone biosynthesis C-methylase UbiE